MTDFKFPASLSEGAGVATVTALNVNAPEPIFVADEFHPHWNAILKGLREGDPHVWELFDVSAGVMRMFKQVTDRVSWDGENVLWDGDPVHSVLAEQLGRAIRDGSPESYTALAKFWEKLESNPNAHSRQMAYDFLATHKFQITGDGDVVGYKGMARTGEFTDDGREVYRSTAASRVHGKPSAFVNGQPVEPLSTVRQSIGDVVSMPRSEVTHDPSRACERGLHVATRSYARAYGTVMEVHVNPRDFVSVPTADAGAKVRVSRYVVAGLASEHVTETAVLTKESREPAWAGDVGYKVD